MPEPDQVFIINPVWILYFAGMIICFWFIIASFDFISKWFYSREERKRLKKEQNAIR